jgi:hypothetical protein
MYSQALRTSQFISSLHFKATKLAATSAKKVLFSHGLLVQQCTDRGRIGTSMLLQGVYEKMIETWWRYASPQTDKHLPQSFLTGNFFR